jgi:hypothetical protein
MKVILDLTPEEVDVLFSHDARWRIRKYVWSDHTEGEIHEYGPSTGGPVATFRSDVVGVRDESIVTALYNAFHRALRED